MNTLREGRFLTPSRVTAWSRVLLADEALAMLFFILWTHGAIVHLQRPLTTDFASFYAAGTLALGTAPHLVYNQAAHFLAEQAATAPGVQYSFFYYPPIFLLLCAPLAKLPYMAAFLLFEGAQLALYLAVARRVLRPAGITWLAPALAFPSVAWSLGIGQNSLLTASLFGGGLLLLERRPALAGMVLGLLCYKPHFGVLLPVALAAGRHWRAFGGAAATVVALAAISLGLFGWETWHDYLLAFAGAGNVYGSGKVDLGGYVTPYGAALLLGAAPGLAASLQVVVFLVVAPLVAVVWRRGAPLAARASVLIAGTLLAVPLALFYDLLPLALCIFWLAGQGRRDGFLPWEKLVLASLYLVPLVSRYVGDGIHVSLGPLASGAVLLFGVLHAPGATRRQVTADVDVHSVGLGNPGLT